MQQLSLVPHTYTQWLEVMKELSAQKAAPGWQEILLEGNCPGVEGVMNGFCTHVEDAVNQILKRCTKQCTRQLNQFLEEGDFSNIEIILRRCARDMEQARFYMYITFLPQKVRTELDRQTMQVIQDYRVHIIQYLQELEEETGSSELADLLYEIRKNHF